MNRRRLVALAAALLLAACGGDGTPLPLDPQALDAQLRARHAALWQEHEGYIAHGRVNAKPQGASAHELDWTLAASRVGGWTELRLHDSPDAPPLLVLHAAATGLQLRLQNRGQRSARRYAAGWEELAAPDAPLSAELAPLAQALRALGSGDETPAAPAWDAVQAEGERILLRRLQPELSLQLRRDDGLPLALSARDAGARCLDASFEAPTAITPWPLLPQALELRLRPCCAAEPALRLRARLRGFEWAAPTSALDADAAGEAGSLAELAQQREVRRWLRAQADAQADADQRCAAAASTGP